MRSRIVWIALLVVILSVLRPEIANAELKYVECWVYEGTKTAKCVAVSSDVGYVAVGTPDGLYLLDSERNLLWEYPTNHPIIDISMTADANRIVAAGSSGYFGGDKVYFFFDLAKDPNISFSVGHGISSVSYSLEGHYFGMAYTGSMGWNDITTLWGDDEGQYLRK